jgi:glycosyltransferase involved in cell wall biosynthesis
MSVVATPSRVPEAFGYSAVEALCSGVPVVASRAGALPEVLGDLGEYMDDPGSSDELASRLRSTLEWSPAKRARWKERAAIARRRFDLSSVVQEYAAIFQSSI